MQSTGANKQTVRCSSNILALLPRDAMLCGVCVCVCVCPSRSCIMSKRINISSNFFSPSGSHTILFFLYHTAWQYSDGNPPNGGVECRWGRLKSRSQRISGLAINNCCIEVCISHFADGFLFTAGIGIRQCCILLHLLDGYTALPRGMHSSLKREQEALKISTSSYSL